jgi:hypothetical protein
MAMTYLSLTAAKGASGAIATWVNYTQLDIPVIVDEAQAVLYGEGRLRCREMQTEYLFTGFNNTGFVALPPNFLDPIGDIMVGTYNSRIRHKDQAYIQNNRTYNETTGTLGTNPFTTVSGSNTVSVALASHGFAQDSIFSTLGATTFNGVTINGTFKITAIIDSNDFTIDISPLGTTPTGSSAGGGSAVTYVCDSLVVGNPYWWGIWDEQIHFDQAFNQTVLCRLNYYKSLPLLSPTNLTNFLTNRYPNLMRVACMAAAADFMKDDTEYQKQFGRLQQMIEKIAMENDMQYRGLDHEPYIP